jgi:hypothetical protein
MPTHHNDAFDKLSELLSISVSQRTPEMRGKDLGNTLNWMHNQGKVGNLNDPTGVPQVGFYAAE